MTASEGARNLGRKCGFGGSAMNTTGQKAELTRSVEPEAPPAAVVEGVRPAASPDQLISVYDWSLADTDQSLSDGDQSRSDADQAAAELDQASADRDQRASDHDQDSADRTHSEMSRVSPAEEIAYRAARDDRATGSLARIRNRLWRTGSTREREVSASDRDRNAAARDRVAQVANAQVVNLAGSINDPDGDLVRRLDELSVVAAAARARAALDRERAAEDRANAAHERARLEAELRLAHLDHLTGTYRREMGQMALSQEIDRARRSDGRFVVAFVDVDGLKEINDRDGHAAGDRVLQAVARAIRTSLRSFDPIIRYGGDEFVCGLSGADLSDAERRFSSIEKAIKADAKVGISVGLAELGSGDTAGALTERADAAMLQVKAQHHMRL
jgi:diguanylate cyclase (GGDEF)-like protein